MIVSKETATLQRRQLFELVWSKPMISLAKDLQVSDNGIRKICRRYNIPVPKIGHWQRVAYGKGESRPALPPFNGEVTIAITPGQKIAPFEIFTEEISVQGRASKPHPLIVEARKEFEVGQKDDKGRVVLKGLDIRVGPSQFSRACRIMDAIFRTLEDKGAKIVVEQQGEWKRLTYAKIDGEKVSFSLRESLKIVKPKIDPTKPIYFQNTQRFFPAGELILTISEYLEGRRTKWADGKGRLEDKLTSFVNGLYTAATILKKRRQDREEEERRQQEAQKQHEARIKAAEDEKRREQVLEQQAVSWQKSRAIRALIRAAARKKGTYSPDSEFGRWVEWASAYADKLDPIR